MKDWKLEQIKQIRAYGLRAEPTALLLAIDDLLADVAKREPASPVTQPENDSLEATHTDASTTFSSVAQSGAGGEPCVAHVSTSGVEGTYEMCGKPSIVRFNGKPYCSELHSRDARHYATLRPPSPSSSREKNFITQACTDYAAHVTKGIRAELETAQRYGRTEYGIEQELRKDIESLREQLEQAKRTVRLEMIAKLKTWIGPGWA